MGKSHPETEEVSGIPRAPHSESLSESCGKNRDEIFREQIMWHQKDCFFKETYLSKRTDTRSMATITDSLSGAVGSASAGRPGLPFSFPLEQKRDKVRKSLHSIQDFVHPDDSFLKLEFY